MTPDELRALADALDRIARTHAMIAPDESETQHRVADHLRAQADAQPVAWMHIDGRVVSAATMDQSYRDGGGMRSSLRDYTIPLYAHPAPAVPPGWKLVPVEPTPEMLQAGANVMEPNGIGWYDADISRAEYRAMLAAAPAAPQAEPKRRSILQAVARGWCHPKNSGKEMDVDLADAIVDEVMAINQAEPKREPACLWSRADDDTDVWETRCGHAFTIIDGTPTDNQMAFCCYCGRRVDEEIGGSDAGTD